MKKRRKVSVQIRVIAVPLWTLMVDVCVCKHCVAGKSQNKNGLKNVPVCTEQRDPYFLVIAKPL